MCESSRNYLFSSNSRDEKKRALLNFSSVFFGLFSVSLGKFLNKRSLLVGVCCCAVFVVFFDKCYPRNLALAQEQGYANKAQNYKSSEPTGAPNAGYGGAQNPQQPAGYGGAQNPQQPAGYGGAQNPQQPAGYGGAQNPQQPAGYGGAQNPQQPAGDGGAYASGYPSYHSAGRNAQAAADEARKNEFSSENQWNHGMPKQPPMYDKNNNIHYSNMPYYAASAPAGGKQEIRAENRMKQSVETYFKGSSEAEKVEMPRHSFESPLTYDNNLNEWELAMASIPAKEHFVLLPGVANRTAQFWNKSPVNTNNFEVSFTFEVKGAEKCLPHGFAFWYVYEEFGKIQPKTEEEFKQWNLYGYKGNFSGLGVFFSSIDKTNAYVKPSISAIYNPPGSSVSYKSVHIPSKDGIYYKFRNTNADNTISIPHVFKLTVSKRSIIGQIRSYTSNHYFPCFHLKDVDILPGGFVGFTGFNGHEVTIKQGDKGKANLVSKVSDMVLLRNFKMYNLDLSKEGEIVNKNSNLHSSVLEDPEISKLLNTDLNSETMQREAMKRISTLLYKLIAELTPRELNILRTLNTLNFSVNKLALALKEIRSDLQMIHGVNHTDIMNSMKTELNGLKTLFHRHSQNHTSTLHYLSSSIDSRLKSARNNSEVKELRELAERAASLEEVIKHRGFASSYLTFAVIVVLIFFAIFVWKRFRDMEKKHYL